MPTAAAAAVIAGMPLQERFGPEDYAAAPVHLAVLAGNDGSMFVGNAEGVLRYDGSAWTRIELPGNSVARALAMGADGRIYVGSYDRFGYLELHPDGEYAFRDLRTRFGLEGEDRHVGNVWTVVATRNAVYFQTDRKLYRLGMDDSTRSWPLPASLRGFFGVGNALYGRVDGRGLARFDDGRLLPLTGGEVFSEQPLNAVLTQNDDLLLVGGDGFYRYRGGAVERMAGDADKLFNEAAPYLAITLSDGTVVVGTLRGELLRFDADLRFLSRVPLGPYSILAMATDAEGGLWVATEGDLLRLRMPSPWTAYSAADGIPGSIVDSAWCGGSLWVANSRGVAVAERGDSGRVRFRQVVRTELETHDLLSTEDGLLIGERFGLLWLPNGSQQAQRIWHGNGVYYLLRSRHDPGVIYAAEQSRFLKLAQNDGGWTVSKEWPLGDVRLSALLETAEDTLWIGDIRGGAERLTLSPDRSQIARSERFGPAQGLDFDPDYGTGLVALDGALYATSGSRSYRFDGQRFHAASQAPFNLVQRPMELDVASTPFGDYAYTQRELFRRAPGETEWHPVHLGSQLARGFSDVHVDADGSLRLVTWNSLLQYDPVETERPGRPLSVSLSRIEYRPGGGDLQLLPLTTDPDILFHAGDGLRLKFALISMEPGAEIRWRLPGRVDSWSDWSSVGDSTVNFGHLDASDYRLQIEGRVSDGRKVQSLEYHFRVETNWYRSSWAMALWLLLALALIATIAHLVSRLRYRNFITINRRLEERIAERTRELEDANERLGELATEDSLTGVANRRAMEQALTREWQRCAETGVPLSVIMVDVDYFKRYNDEHGHLAGDRQLRWVAAELSRKTQPVRELVARFGGEEFVLILPGFNADRGVQRAEELRRRFTQADSAVTISLGVATQVPRLDDDPAQLLQRADTALYCAKRRGRNRVELAED
ncbi:MAG: diguanylate cyclase [Xanthomonadales bacterium]|nr:diguanylate cyclase [Xanthomonadales bacterium]